MSCTVRGEESDREAEKRCEEQRELAQFWGFFEISLRPDNKWLNKLTLS